MWYDVLQIYVWKWSALPCATETLLSFDFKYLTSVAILPSLAGYPPFSDELKKYTLNEQIIKGIYSFPDKYWKTVSGEGK